MLSPTQASGIIVKMMESQTLLKNDFISRHMEPVGRYFPLSNIWYEEGILVGISNHCDLTHGKKKLLRPSCTADPQLNCYQVCAFSIRHSPKGINVFDTNVYQVWKRLWLPKLELLTFFAFRHMAEPELKDKFKEDFGSFDNLMYAPQQTPLTSLASTLLSWQKERPSKRCSGPTLPSTSLTHLAESWRYWLGVKKRLTCLDRFWYRTSLLCLLSCFPSADFPTFRIRWEVTQPLWFVTDF